MSPCIHACTPVWGGEDEEFSRAFYAPFQAAVESALALLGRARRELSRTDGPLCVSSVTFRLKTPASIRGKLRRKGLPATAEAAQAALHDIAGLRVVLKSETQIDAFAALLRASPAAELLCERDYIRSPKESGYRSLHLLLRVPVFYASGAGMAPVEIQLRTQEMDGWASAEHDLIYKPGGAGLAVMPADPAGA